MTLLPPAEPEHWAMTELVPFSQNFSLGNIDRVIKSIKYRHINSLFILCPVKYNIGKNSSDHSAVFSSINIKKFEAYVKVKFDNEMYIAKIKNTYDKFLGKWSSLYHYFMDGSLSL